MRAWINIKDELPPLNRYVLIRHKLTNHFDSHDQLGVQYDVAKRRTAQEFGNNHRDYEWTTFGPMTYFGKDVDFWMEIERIP